MAASFDFEEFFVGYIECALWAETDESTEEGGEPFDRNYGREDIAQSSLDAMRRDCKAFADANLADLELYCQNVVRQTVRSPSNYAGHDLWLTANGHGCGFWDRDGVGESGRGEAPEGLGDRLTKASEAFASDLCLGDDGQIYVSPETR